MSATTATIPVDPAPPRRDDLFGVCAAIGADFGFDPFWLRLALAIGVIAAPIVVLVGYATAAVLVILSRLCVRDRRPARPSAEIVAIAPPHAPAEPALRRAA